MIFRAFFVAILLLSLWHVRIGRSLPATRAALREAPAPPMVFYVVKGRARCVRSRLRPLDRRRRAGRFERGGALQEISAAGRGSPSADVFFLARRQSGSGAGDGRHASRTARGGEGGANRGQGMRLRGAGRRCLPQAEAIRPRAPRRSLDPRRDVQLRLSLSDAGRDHPRDRARRAACRAFSESGRAHFRRRADPQMRAAATRAASNAPIACCRKYVVRMGAEVRAAGSRSERSSSKACTSSPARRLQRFGIDRRDFVETPWTFENGGRSLVRKIGDSKEATGTNSCRMSQWRLFCFNADQFELDFQRPAHGHTRRSPPFRFRLALPKPLYFTFPPARSAGFEVWGLRMNQRVDPVAGRFAAVRLHRDLAGAGWAAARSPRRNSPPKAWPAR